MYWRNEGEIRKGKVFDVAPAALTTVISAVPGFKRSLAGICAVSVVEFTKVVLSDKPFNCALVLLVKPDPVIVTSKDAIPAVAEGGFTDSIVESATVLGLAISAAKLVPKIAPRLPGATGCPAALTPVMEGG